MLGVDALTRVVRDQVVSKGAKGVRPTARQLKALDSSFSKLEDLIPDLPASIEAEVPAATLRALIQVMRGTFAEGVSLVLNPAGDDGPGVSIRLQEGRQYLDSDTETLFARYGLAPQEWTVVGMIGYHAAPPSGDQVADADFMNDSVLNRGKFVSFVNRTVQSMGASGLIEMPQAPGFSLIPIAVYRQIPRPTLIQSAGEST